MKITYFLRGLGIGIIFSALILSIAFHSSNSSMTDEMVIERAKELGMMEAGDSDDALDQLLSQKEDTTGEESSEEQGEKTSTEEQSSEADTTEAASTQEQTTETATTEAQTTEKATTEEKKKEPQTVSVTISRGMYSELVAETLASLGVIDNASSFNKYLNDHGYAGRLVVGTYKLTPGEDFDSIARKITGQ